MKIVLAASPKNLSGHGTRFFVSGEPQHFQPQRTVFYDFQPAGKDAGLDSVEEFEVHIRHLNPDGPEEEIQEMVEKARRAFEEAKLKGG